MAEQHPGLDALADLLATGAADDDSHVRGCAHCRAQLTELREALVPVAASLAALPVPAAPKDLDRRISTALDRARARQNRSSATPRSRQGRLVWLPIAAGLAAAASLVVTVVVRNDRPSADNPQTAQADLSTRTSSTGLDYAKDGKLLTTELPALLHGTAARRAAAGAEATAVDQKSASTDALARLRTTQGLAGCLAGLTDGAAAEQPLALDYASFERQPALVVVMPSTKKEKVDVFVVGAGCAQADPQLLYFLRANAPT